MNEVSKILEKAFVDTINVIAERPCNCPPMFSKSIIFKIVDWNIMYRDFQSDSMKLVCMISSLEVNLSVRVFCRRKSRCLVELNWMLLMVSKVKKERPGNGASKRSLNLKWWTEIPSSFSTSLHIISFHSLCPPSTVVLCVDYWIFQTSQKLTLELILTMPLFLLSLASKNINYDSQGNKGIEHKSITDKAFIKIFSLAVLNFLKKRHLFDTRQICRENVSYMVFMVFWKEILFSIRNFYPKF